MSLNCSFNIKVENITDIIGKDTFKNLTQEECESVITQLMSSYNLTQEALLDNKYKSDIINAIKRGREEASKAISVSTTTERVLENEKAITILENEGITLDNSLIDKYLLEVKASNPYHQIFKQIVGILKNNNIPINVVVNSSLSNIAARKQDGFKTATIEINPILLLDYLMTDNKDNVKENLMKILTHELVHAVTAEILNYHPSWAKIKGFNEAQTEFSNNVWNLYLQCKEQLKGTKWYGLTNAKEFIAVALTDRNFQIELSKIKLDKNENAFKRFINYLTNLFNKVFKAQGIDIKNSALEEIISISQEYFNSANKDLRGGIYDYTGTRDYYDDNESFTWNRTSNNSYEVSSKGDKRFSALYATFNKGTIIDGVDVGGMTIEDVYQKVIKKSGKGKAPAKDSRLNLLNSDNFSTTFKNFPEGVTNVFYGADDEVPRVIFKAPNGEIGQITYEKNRWRISRKQKNSKGEEVFYGETLSPEYIDKIVNKFIPSKFKEYVESGQINKDYSKDFQDNEGRVQQFFRENYNIHLINEYFFEKGKHETFEDFSYYEAYLPLWQEWAKQNPELIDELRIKAKGKTLTDQFANTRVSQARALADILNNSTKGAKKNTTSVTKIISGGQTGVDTIGLQVAKELGIETGGKAPKGFLREEGYDKEDIASYGLEEITDEEQADYTKRTGKKDPYTGRTELNVRNSDGTVYFNVGSDTAGLIATRRSAKEWNKPFIENPTAEELRQWIKDNNIKTLNVAGNRGTKLAKDNKVAATLKEALTDTSAANVIKESEYSKQLIKILQSLVNKIKASNIKEAKAAQNLYEWTIQAQQAILDAIERGERKDEDLSLDKVQEQLNNLIQKTPKNLAEGAIKAAKEMSKDWGKSTEQKSKKETKKSDKTLKETIESAKAKRPTFDSIEVGKIQKRLLSIYFPNVTERIAATNFISDYFSIILDNTVSGFKEAISNNEEAFRDKLGDEEYERLYKGLFSGNSSQQRVFALGLTLGEKAVPLQIFDRVKNLIDSFKNTQDIKELVYQWYLNKDNTVKMDSFLGNEFSWEANQNGWDTPKKLEEMATLRVRAMKSYFTKHFGDDRVFDALVKEAAFDIEFNENIRLDTRGNIMENNQEREDKENDVENEEENPNKEGYMIKYKLLDPIDTISVKLKNKLAHLYKMNFNLKRNNDVEYVFNSLGLRVKLNPMIAYYTILNEFQSISSEDELNEMFEDAVTKYPWLQSLKDNVVFNPLVPQEFDIDFRKEFFRACKSFAPFAMVTKDGTIAYLNRDNQSTTFLDMVKTNYEGHNVLGENSIFNEDGTRNSGNVETIFYLLTSGERKDKEGKKKKDDVNKHPFFLVKNILKKNKASVFELFTALQILRGEHPEYKSIKVNNVIYKDISLEGLLRNLGIETTNMNLEALIPATFALEVDDEGNTIGSKESPEFTDEFIDEAEANGYSNPVDYFNSLFTPKMRRYLSTILEKATVITRPKQGYQSGDNLVIKFQNSYLSIGNALTMANEAYSQTSFRFNNNTRFSYVAYDMITRMSNLLSKTSTDEAVARGTKYLEDNYGQYDFFRDQKTGEWNNVWLQQWFEQDEHGEYTIRENFKILNMLGFGGNEDKDSFGKVSSETLMDSHILAFLNGNKDKWGNEYGYYRNALFSDTDASVLVKQIRYTGDNYKEVIINNLAKVLRQEIERIISVMKSSEDPNTIKIEFYNEGKKNGQKFNFFPALNAKEKYIQVLTEYNRLSQLNSAEFKEQSDKFLAGLVTDIIEGEVDPVTGLRTGGKLQEFLNSIDETRRKSLYRKILKINTAKEKSEESEEDEDSTKKLLGEVFGDEEESTKEDTKKTSEEQRRELDEILTNFFYNDYFAQSQIIQIFGGDLAYYKNFRDFIKRNKQAYAAGDRLYGMLMDEQGNNIEPLTETAIYVEDKFELSNTYDSIKQLLNSAVGVSKMSRDLILGALSSYKNICATDGQSFRTPESIKKILQAMGGKWTDDMEEAFNRMTVEGKLDIKDFYTIWNNIKPFLYSHETVQVGDRKEKVVTQHKNSEYMMTAMYSMITSALSNSPQLKALQEFMKDNNIDVVHFHSVVKEGYFNGININYSIKRFNEKKGENDYIEVAGNRINADTYEDFRKNLIQALDDEKITQEDYNQAIRDIDFEKSEEGVDDCYNQLADAIFEEGEDGVYRINETKLHKFPLSDYMVVQPSGDHLTEDDLMAIFGSQLRNIIPADLPESFIAKVKLGNKNKEFTRDEYIKLYNTLIVDQLLDSFARVSDEFSSVEKLQSALLAKIHGNPKYGSDVEEALQLEDAGNGNKRFKIPFNNPNLNNKIEELILSTFKNAIQKQKINGGNIILVSNFGLSDDLHVQYKTDENGNKCIDYIPCYMPAYKRSLIQDFLIPRKDSKTGEEWWEVDYEKMKGNEDLLEMIGYRIPTENKYSIFKMRIMGFLPISAGTAIMLPSDIISMSGTDFKQH